MIYHIYSIYDEKTRLFGNLMLFATAEEATRYFSFLVNEDKNRMVCKDLVLYWTGLFDSEKGTITKEDIPHKMIHSTEVLESNVRGD